MARITRDAQRNLFIGSKHTGLSLRRRRESAHNPGSMSFLDALKERIPILDGAMGTRLRELGYEGTSTDFANLHCPDLVREAHREYREAGADVVETNTFSANAFRLHVAGSIHSARDINLAG